ncbi:MAG: LON peptidase substrate-binding domain-containing protein [Actinomycetota bacterium]
MERPVFARHAVLFPGERMAMRVFEERYLEMMEEVLPEGTFVVVAIREGREVGGEYEPYRVGVTVAVEDYSFDVEDSTYRLRLVGRKRVAMIERSQAVPFPRWEVAPYPDERGAGTDDVEAAARALARYLDAVGDGALERASLPRDPVAASYVIAAAVPGLLPARQALLEAPGAGERLERSRATLVRETGLVRALGANVGGPTLDVNPN